MGEQADLPTECTQASEAARLPRADVDPCRPSRHQGTAAEGPSQALCLTWRIRDRETFARLRAEGTRSRKGPVTVTFLADDGPGPPRVAYSVGRRVGGAVVRNKLRRRLRDIVSGIAPHLPPGAYLIGVAPRAVSMSFEELRATVGGAFHGMTADVTGRATRADGAEGR